MAKCNLCGSELTTGDGGFVCRTCQFKPYVPKGWECPRCRAINSPWVTQCPCNSPSTIKMTPEMFAGNPNPGGNL
jgi:hypothetical protein